MILNLRQAFLSFLYAAALSWLLIYEIVPRWNYMLYSGEFSAGALAAALGFSAVLGASVPVGNDVRAMLVSSLNYIFFVPSVVYASFSDPQYEYIISFIILFFCVYFFSRVKVRCFEIYPIEQRKIAISVIVLTAVSVIAEAAFGGLAHFNLNIERVYEFRAISSEEMPPIFGYLFSNTANILIPISLIFSLKSRSYILSATIVVLAILLFGMTHQKSVFFIPFSVFLLYLCFSRPKSQYLVGYVFLVISIISIVEVLYFRFFLQVDDIAYFTSYTIRRVFFTPPMLDKLFVEFFSSHDKYYWASSRFGSWASDSPYNLVAPNLIGRVYFLNPDVAANTGAIGSGFAQAGILGVSIYSLIIGLLISVLNSYGKKIGSEFVASTSLIIIFLTVTTTDLSTAILSHGLFMLIFILSLFAISERDGRMDRMLDT